MSLARWQLPPSEDPSDTGLSGTKIAAYILNYGGSGLALWLVFFGWPFPVAFVATAILPFAGAALLLRTPDEVRFSGDRKQPGLHFMMIGVPAALAFTGADHEQRPDLSHFVLTGALGLIAAAIVVWNFAAVRRSLLYVSFVVLFCAVYWFGILSFLNIQFDASSGERTRTNYISISHPRRGGPLFYSVNVPQIGSLKITRSDYIVLSETGGPVCVTEHPGALGTPWFEVTPCP